MSGEETLQLQAGLFVAGGNRDFREVLLVVAFRVAGGVLGQTEDGSFFRLRPQALAADVGADSGEDLGTEHAQQKDADHDGDENANNDQQLTGDGKAAKHFFLNSHAGVRSPETRRWRNIQLPRPHGRKVNS